MLQTKDSLRQELLAWRNQLSPDFVQEASKKIVANLITLDGLVKARVVSAYAAIGNEAHVTVAIGHLINNGKIVAVPVYDQAAQHYRFGRFLDPNKLKPGRFGVLEPYQTQAISPAQINVALIPGVGFDRNGNRLGFGKGVFDRLLSVLPKNCLKIGVCYQEQIVDRVPVTEYDQKMNMLVTQDGQTTV